jgi:hypothetical protein
LRQSRNPLLMDSPSANRHLGDTQDFSLRKGGFMRNGFIGDVEDRLGQGRAGISVGAITVAVLVPFVLAGVLEGPARAVTLRWKLKQGDVLHYTLDEKSVSTAKVTGREIKSKRSHTVNLSWNVKSVSANGDAQVTLRFVRVRMHIEQPPFMPFDFDSSAALTDAPEPFASIGRQVKAMAGVEFTFGLKPTGAVQDVKISEATIKTLRDGLGPAGAQGGMFSEQGIKDVLVQSSPPPLPDGSLEPGKSWAAKPLRLALPQLGTMVVDKVFTFEGPDPRTPKLMRIAAQTRVALEPGDNAAAAAPGQGPDLAAKITAQEGKGTLTFDAEAGRITRSEGVQKMDMQFTGPMEQKVDQKTETTTTLTLEP